MQDEIEGRIIGILHKIKGSKEASFEPQTDLFAAGILDSFGMIEYLGALEKDFNIKIANEDLTPQNLSNVNASVRLVKAYLAKPSS